MTNILGISGDLKVIALVLGLQLGCTKFFVSSASGTVETEKITIAERTGQNVTLLLQEIKCSAPSTGQS
jgi:hypothetical protein